MKRIALIWVILCMVGVSAAEPARVALVQLDGLMTQDREAYLEQALDYLDSVAVRRPALVVFPEAVNLGPGLDLTYADVALSLDAPILQQVASAARTMGAFIIFPIIEQADSTLYNTALVYDRTGALRGLYRKTHEPRAVLESQRVSLGDEWPVFDLGFARVGILICYDIMFPEAAQIYGLKDADLVVMPHLMSTVLKGKGDHFEIRTRARALDACVHVAACGWYRPRDEGQAGPLSATCLVDYKGRVVGQASQDCPQVLWIEYDFKQPRITENLGVYGRAEWKPVFWGERRPHLYRLLVRDNRLWRDWATEANY